MEKAKPKVTPAELVEQGIEEIKSGHRQRSANVWLTGAVGIIATATFALVTWALSYVSDIKSAVTQRDKDAAVNAALLDGKFTGVNARFDSVLKAIETVTNSVSSVGARLDAYITKNDQDVKDLKNTYSDMKLQIALLAQRREDDTQRKTKP